MLVVTSFIQDLRWRLHTETAVVLERWGDIEGCRKAYVEAVLVCPAMLVWKLWISGTLRTVILSCQQGQTCNQMRFAAGQTGARMELRTGSVANARKLGLRALRDVPRKSRFAVILERSRIEEWAGEYKAARSILDSAKRDADAEWKVCKTAWLMELSFQA